MRKKKNPCKQSLFVSLPVLFTDKSQVPRIGGRRRGEKENREGSAVRREEEDATGNCKD